MSTRQAPAWAIGYAGGFVAARTEAASLACSVSDEQLRQPTGNAGWTLRDEFLHIASSEKDFMVALGTLVEGRTPDLSVFANIDERSARNLAAWRDRSMTEVADTLEQHAVALNELLARLDEADGTRQPEGMPFAIGEMVRGYAMHDGYHLGQIRAGLRLDR